MRFDPSEYIVRGGQVGSKPAFSAEKAVNDRLAQTPELYLLALAQFAASADTEVVSGASCIPRRKLTGY